MQCFPNIFDYGALLFRELCWGNVGVGFTVSESVEPQKAWLLCFNHGAAGLLATQHEPGHLQRKAVTPRIGIAGYLCSLFKTLYNKKMGQSTC